MVGNWPAFAKSFIKKTNQKYSLKSHLSSHAKARKLKNQNSFLSCFKFNSFVSISLSFFHFLFSFSFRFILSHLSFFFPPFSPDFLSLFSSFFLTWTELIFGGVEWVRCGEIAGEHHYSWHYFKCLRVF